LVLAKVTAAGGTFVAKWVPGPSSEALLDEEGRLTSKEKAQELQRTLSGGQGRVQTCSTKKKSEPPPLPYCLSDLQIEASRRFDLGPSAVLEACQSLYEAKLLTYPRSDCSYLPEGHHAQGVQVAASIAKSLPGLAALAAQANTGLKSRAWDDAKVTAHHALIPTSASADTGKLSGAELKIYELVARRYLAQFFPSYEFLSTEVVLELGGEVFRASGRQPVSPGWRVTGAEVSDEVEGGPAMKKQKEQEDGANSVIPPLTEGQAVKAADILSAERKTRPPSHFTEATLVEAMRAIGRYVADPKVRQILKETDGLGTEATRAETIKTLFSRRYVEKKGKKVLSTATGRSLIQTLPGEATTPDMTALWEAAMRRIVEGRMSLDEFLAGVTKRLGNLVTEGKARGRLIAPGAHRCPTVGCDGVLRRLKRKDGSGHFWVCPSCRGVGADENRQPSKAFRQSGASKPNSTSPPLRNVSRHEA